MDSTNKLVYIAGLTIAVIDDDLRILESLVNL